MLVQSKASRVLYPRISTILATIETQHTSESTSNKIKNKRGKESPSTYNSHYPLRRGQQDPAMVVKHKAGWRLGQRRRMTPAILRAGDNIHQSSPVIHRRPLRSLPPPGLLLGSPCLLLLFRGAAKTRPLFGGGDQNWERSETRGPQMRSSVGKAKRRGRGGRNTHHLEGASRMQTRC